MIVIFEERPSTEESVFIGTLGGRDDASKAREVTKVGLEPRNEQEPRRIVKNGIEDV